MLHGRVRKSGDRIIDFCRLRLGMKPLVDRWQTRRRLNGICDYPVRTVFDIGANVGKFARLLRRRFRQATIYCVEPLPCCHGQLVRWAEQDGNAKVLRCALGAVPGRSTIWWNTAWWGGSSLVEPQPTPDVQRIEVEVETLDRVASRLAIEDDILIKIDVEGLELEVMRGGSETLRRAKALIVEVPTIEWNARPSFAEIVAFLEPFGYIYRGSLGCACVRGVPQLADAVFAKRVDAMPARFDRAAEVSASAAQTQRLAYKCQSRCGSAMPTP